VISQRLRIRVADELRGSSASFKVAANRSSIGFFLSAMMAFSLARLAAAFWSSACDDYSSRSNSSLPCLAPGFPRLRGYQRLTAGTGN